MVVVVVVVFVVVVVVKVTTFSNFWHSDRVASTMATNYFLNHCNHNSFNSFKYFFEFLNFDLISESGRFAHHSSYRESSVYCCS